MHKVYKSLNYSFGEKEPYKLDNTVIIPTEGQNDAAESELRRIKQRETEREKHVFNEAVEAEVNKIVSAERAAIEQERARILDTAQKNAKVIISDAKKNTSDIIEKTQKECAILKERAKNEGHDEGFEAGKKEAMEKCSRYVDAAAQLISEINSRKEAYYLANEQELKDTLLCMVEKITKIQLRSDSQVIVKIIADAAKNFRNSDYLKISLAEGEISRELKSDNKLIKELIPYVRDIEIEILPEAEEGTVILDNDETIVDASIPTQLDFLREILNNTRGRNEEN